MAPQDLLLQASVLSPQVNLRSTPQLSLQQAESTLLFAYPFPHNACLEASSVYTVLKANLLGFAWCCISLRESSILLQNLLWFILHLTIEHMEIFLCGSPTSKSAGRFSSSLTISVESKATSYLFAQGQSQSVFVEPCVSMVGLSLSSKLRTSQSLPMKEVTLPLMYHLEFRNAQVGKPFLLNFKRVFAYH